MSLMSSWIASWNVSVGSRGLFTKAGRNLDSRHYEAFSCDPIDSNIPQANSSPSHYKCAISLLHVGFPSSNFTWQYFNQGNILINRCNYFFFQWQVMVRCLHPWPSKLWAERMKWSYGPHFKSIRSHTTCWSQRQVTLKMFQPWRVWTLTIKLGQLLVHQADNDCFQQRSS